MLIQPPNPLMVTGVVTVLRRIANYRAELKERGR